MQTPFIQTTDEKEAYKYIKRKTSSKKDAPDKNE